jgi:hypothetical protein
VAARDLLVLERTFSDDCGNFFHVLCGFHFAIMGSVVTVKEFTANR